MREDKTDPICGMKGHIKAHGKYFCSQHCIEKYEKQNKIKHCFHCDIKGGHRPWYKERLYVVGLITIVLILISYLIPPLNNLYIAFIDYLKLIWWAVLLGLLIGGFIDHLIPREYIEKYLSEHKKRTIGYAVLFGFLMSACSHGILAISMELYKKGANTSSVIAFLLASPWANMPITILLFGFFGFKALFFVISAIVIAIITGLIYQVLERKGLVETNILHSKKKKDLANFSIIQDIKKRWNRYKFTFDNIIEDVKGVLRGSWSLAKMVVWWLLIGVVLSALARTFVPSDFFMEYMGATLLGLIVTLVLATIIEVCSEGSSPMAFEIYKQTGAFGNSFIFLVSGVISDYTELGLIWTNIGKKAAIWLPIIGIPQAVILGYLFNILL